MCSKQNRKFRSKCIQHDYRNKWIKNFKGVSCKYECRLDERRFNSGQWQNNVNISVKCHACGKKFIWNPSTCSCKNGKYLASIMDDSAIMCDEIIESYDKETKAIPTNFNKKYNL